MNRIDFMLELSSLLQDISEEERTEAMQYYNDYFDDAGEENEQKIITELGSPAKVAAEVKEGLKGHAGDTAEYRETGYADTRFEQKNHLTDRVERCSDANVSPEQTPPRNSKLLKWILIMLILLAAAPVVLPVAGGILGTILTIIVVGIILAFVAVIVAICMIVAGILVVGAGIVVLIPEFATGIALIGGGLVCTSVGIIATALFMKLCVKGLPAIFRGIVELIRKLFHRGKVVS